MHTHFPHQDTVASLLQASLPACRGGSARVEACRLVEVVTGRRNKMFALADLDMSSAEATGVVTRRMVIHAYPSGAEDEGRKVFRRLRRMAREQERTAALKPWAAFLAEQRWLVVPFPFDYRLPHLSVMCEPTAMTHALRSAGVDAEMLTVTPVRYVPEKRCQLRYEVELGDGTTAVFFGKTAAGDNGADVVRWMGDLHAHFATSPVAGTPAPVAHLPQWQAVVQRGVGGRTLYDAQRAGRVPARVYRNAGVALAELHGAPLHGLSSYGHTDELSLLAMMLDKDVLHGRARVRAEALLDELRDRRDDGSGTRDAAQVTSHRDFYDKQVLNDGDRLWVIDLDTLTRAPRALDVGNFVAHLRLRSRQGFVDSSHAQVARLVFIAGYRHQLDAAELAWWTASALLRLSVIYAVRPAWSHLTSLLLDDAAAVLAGGDIAALDVRMESEAVTA